MLEESVKKIVSILSVIFIVVLLSSCVFPIPIPLPPKSDTASSETVSVPSASLPEQEPESKITLPPTEYSRTGNIIRYNGISFEMPSEGIPMISESGALDIWFDTYASISFLPIVIDDEPMEFTASNATFILEEGIDYTIPLYETAEFQNIQSMTINNTTTYYTTAILTGKIDDPSHFNFNATLIIFPIDEIAYGIIFQTLDFTYEQYEPYLQQVLDSITEY